MKPYMIEHNWLVNYQYTKGIERILTQMDRRTKDVSQMQFAIEELEKYYAEFETEFTSFFQDLITYVAQKTSEL
jgi:acyl carrier protein phosphodiesterase